LNYSFFGSVNKHSTLWIFLIFAVGYFARIIGALVFGYWGDKLGRLYSFKKTVVIMAISSMVIGFLPTYESVGILAVVLLITLRFIQGISYGGEMSGATIVIVENYKKNQPLLILVIALMSVAGVFLAKSTYSILGYFFNHHDMMDYGWRIAYIFGGIMIFHSYFARKYIAESEEFKFTQKNSVYKNTIHEMLSSYKSLLLIGICCLPLMQLFWGVLMVYLPSFMALKYNSSSLISNIYNIMTLGMLVGCILGAVFANITNIRVVYSVGAVLTFLLVPLFYYSINSGGSDHTIFYTLLLLLSITESASGVLTLLLISKRLPVKYRYTLVSTSFALGYFLFIGLPPIIFSYFTREANMYYPILVYGVGVVISLIAVQVFYKKTEKFVSA
jgi:MFS family permease